MRRKWHIQRTSDSLALSRRGEVVFDVSAQSVFPLCARGRLAQQIRQDLWRALQDLRGFSPVILIEGQGAELHVTAGGEVAAKTFPKPAIEAQISALLADPKLRARWLRHAAISADAVNA
ncbi:hypothetical protein [Falsihalocynthiibacter arcticus]|uniref:hypothetical protein n=1 Tax=Falsihalocynthiibacter arcticus TaxID=1579316 RepID=UPI0030017ACB